MTQKIVTGILINKSDNVAVVTEKVDIDDIVHYADFDGHDVKICSLEAIPIYHKIAIHDIDQFSPVIKYGEQIGLAKQKIVIGEHVHSQNLVSKDEI